MRNKLFAALVIALFLALGPTVAASTTWYVNGVSGSDSNNCKSRTSACKTIKHAISLASFGDTIMVAATTYKENLTIGKSLNVIGSGASTTIIDGGGIDTVIAASNRASTVTLSHLTIRNGKATTFSFGGGILNHATMIITNCRVTTNFASQSGGGIENESGKLTINDSTISGNSTNGDGAGIENIAVMTINNGTISDNKLVGRQLFAVGGGIFNVWGDGDNEQQHRLREHNRRSI